MRNRICFYVFGLPPDFSGATNQAIRLSLELHNRSIETVFLTYTFDEQNLKLQHPGIVTQKFLRNDSGMIRYHAKALWHLFLLRKRFEVLYLNGNDGQFWTAFYFSLFARLFGKKLVMELNMEYPDPLCIAGTKFEELKRIASRRVHAYICLSSIILEKMRKFHPGVNAQLVFNGVDVDRFQPASGIEQKTALRRILGLPEEAPVVVTCGAICKRKGIDFLLDVWERVIRQRPEARLYLLGPFEINGYHDDFAKKAMERAKEARYLNSVVFCGCVDNVEEYFRAADLFIFAGRQEGSPNVLREAMAAGLPVVTLQLAGITDDMVVEGVNGFVVPVPDQETLRNYQECDIVDPNIHRLFAEYTEKLLDDNTLRFSMGSSGRKIALELFSIQTQVDRLLQLVGK